MAVPHLHKLGRWTRRRLSCLRSRRCGMRRYRGQSERALRRAPSRERAFRSPVTQRIDPDPITVEGGRSSRQPKIAQPNLAAILPMELADNVEDGTALV